MERISSSVYLSRRIEFIADMISSDSSLLIYSCIIDIIQGTKILGKFPLNNTFEF